MTVLYTELCIKAQLLTEDAHPTIYARHVGHLMWLHMETHNPTFKVWTWRLTGHSIFRAHPCGMMYQLVIPFCDLIIFHWMDILHFVYLFISWWTFGYFYLLSIMNYVFMWTYVFYMPKSHNAFLSLYFYLFKKHFWTYLYINFLSHITLAHIFF